LGAEEEVAAEEEEEEEEVDGMAGGNAGGRWARRGLGEG
jgi:hypothetical protein